MARIKECLAGEEPWSAYWLDVAGHAGLGAAWALPIQTVALWLGWGPWWAFGLGEVAAVLGGAGREILQYLKSRKLHPLDRSLDVLHHVLGPPISLGLAYLLVYLLGLLIT